MFTNRKMLISVGLVIVLFVGGLLAFVIIPNELNKFRPASWEKGTSTASVSGNGGNAVMVGHYLYFTSGFVGKGTIKYKQNEYNKIRGLGQGGIWRVKLNNGAVEYDNTYLKNHLKDIDFDIMFDSTRTFLDVDRYTEGQDEDIAKAMDKRVKKGTLELIVPKIAGFENTALWIFGDNLIYTSPNNEQARDHKVQTDKIDYFRCSLTGDKNERIYTTRTDNTGEGDVAHTVVWAGNRPNLLIKDGTRLVSVSMKGHVTTITDKVENYVFPSVASYYSKDTMGGLDGLGGGTLDASREGSYSGIMGYVYYTVAATEDDEIKGNQLWRYQVSNGVRVKMGKTMPNDTVRLLTLGNGHLVYEVDTADSGTRLYVTRNIAVPHDDSEWQPIAVKDFENGNPTAVVTSGERTTVADFRFYTVTEGSLRKWSLGQWGDTIGTVSTEVATGVEGVVSIMQSGIVYGTDGGYKTLWFDGTVTTANNKIGGEGISALGERVGVFHLLDKNGVRIEGYRMFLGTEITEAHDEEEAGEHSHDTMEKRVTAIMMTLGGEREYVIDWVPDDFIAWPKAKNILVND